MPIEEVRRYEEGVRDAAQGLRLLLGGLAKHAKELGLSKGAFAITDAAEKLARATARDFRKLSSATLADKLVAFVEGLLADSAWSRVVLRAMEYVYSSRFDSEIDGVEVAEVRARLGQAIASKVKNSVDVIIGVSDTGLYYAAWAARALGAQHAPGLVSTVRKRSALLDDVRDRVSAIQLKANVVRHAARGRGCS